MRTFLNTSEKNAEFRSKYSGLNKISNQTSHLTSRNKNLSHDERTITHKGTFDSGPLLVSNRIEKSENKYKLPYSQGENIETTELGEKVWKHQNRNVYEEKIRRKVKKDPIQSSNIETDKKQLKSKNDLNNCTQSDLNNNSLIKELNKTSKNAYIYGLTNFNGGEHDDGQISSNHPFMDQPIMIDKAIQCELKKTKKSCNLNEIRLKNFIKTDSNEKTKLREYSSNKWFYDKHEFDSNEIDQGKESRKIDNLSPIKITKLTKNIDPSNIEHKVKVKKKENTEYKTGLSATIRVIQPDENGAVSAYSNVPPLSILNTRNLGKNAAGQNVVLTKPREVIYSQVDKTKKNLLRDQTQSPLPSYADDINDYKLNPDQSYVPTAPMFKTSSKPPSRSSSRLASRSPSPVNRNKLIYLHIPSEKQKVQVQNQYSADSSNKKQILSNEPNKVTRTKTYKLNYNPGTIEPPPQFSSLGRTSKSSNKLPPRVPTPKKSINLQQTSNIRRIPIEKDQTYFLDQANLSDHSSIDKTKKSNYILEDEISIISTSSEFDLDKPKSIIVDSTIRELDKKNKKIFYENQPNNNIKNSSHELEAPLANSIWYKSLDDDYRKGMASNDICLPNIINGNNNKDNYSSTISKFDYNTKEKKLFSSNEDNRNVYTLDKKHLENKKNKKLESSVIRRATSKENDFFDNRDRKFHSTKNLSTLTNPSQLNLGRNLALSQIELGDSRNEYKKYHNFETSSNESNIIANSNYYNKSLNYPLKPVTRSASMYGGTQMLNMTREHSSALFRSTESDANCGYNNNTYNRSTSRPISRRSSNYNGLHQNDPVVLYLPAIDNSAKLRSNKLGNKKLASSVNNINSVSRTNSILSKFRNSSKKDVNKSCEKLNEVTQKLNQYSPNSKSNLNYKKMQTEEKKKAIQIKRSQSIPKNTKLPFLQKLRNKLKTRD